MIISYLLNKRCKISELILFFALSGCSHFASNTNACKEAPILLPLPYSILGNVFQISPCTSIEVLRIETGMELDGIRGGVDAAIVSEQPNYSTKQFSARMGCRSTEKFLKGLISKKNEIFGDGFTSSNREVVKKQGSFNNLSARSNER
jgi:hypothetical protein